MVRVRARGTGWAMSCRSPKHRRLAERLETITHETLVVVVIAGELAKGEPLTDIAESLHGPH